MKRRTSLAIAFVGLLGLLAMVGPVSAANRSVKMGEANERYFFAPKTQYVNVGDTVTWTNGTDKAHTVTSDSGSELDSGQLADSATFPHTFSVEGTFAYHCTIHPYMTAKVVVLAAGAALPATDTSSAAPSGSHRSGNRLPFLLLAGLAVGGLAIRRVRKVIEV